MVSSTTVTLIEITYALFQMGINLTWDHCSTCLPYPTQQRWEYRWYMPTVGEKM